MSETTTEQLYMIEVILPAIAKDAFMDGLEEFADSMSCFEYGSDDVWKLQIYTQTLPDEEELSDYLAMLSAANDILLPKYTITEVEQVDWVTESQKNFQPVEAGKFFVYPSWRRGEVPQGFSGIEIDPQRAFGTGGHETTKGCLLAMHGTGGHETTKGCLLAMQKLAEKHQFKNMLDMGCGSGILAIGMAKIWPEGKILAVDNDHVCVDTTITNAEINRVSERIAAWHSDGYTSEIVGGNIPYDLITSNILAAPLIEFAPMASSALAEGGYLILAGLLVTQADGVLAAHTKQGLSLVDRNDYGDWAVLVLGK
ncbi:MAG: prmA [Rickettsiaceae bacterium]|nr:prmA [Rickettsiaceae bacterium]